MGYSNMVKPIIWGKNIVYTASDHSITQVSQVSQICWVILKRLRASDIMI